MEAAAARAAYARSLPDAAWFGARGGKLPMRMGGRDAQPGRLLRSLLPALRRRADAGLRARRHRRRAAGRDDAPDILVVSLSGHDYVNHPGAPSRACRTTTAAARPLLQDFFRDLDAAWAATTTSPCCRPTTASCRRPSEPGQGRRAGRITGAAMLQRVNADWSALRRAASWCWASASALVLDRALLAQRGSTPTAVAPPPATRCWPSPASRGLHAARAGKRQPRRRPLFAAMRRSWNRERSGDVQYAAQPNWMFGTATAPTARPTSTTRTCRCCSGARAGSGRRVATPVERSTSRRRWRGLLRAAPAASEGRPAAAAGPDAGSFTQRIHCAHAGRTPRDS
jgi:hypothetical protein